MRRWGLVVSAVYALIVVVLLVPMAVLLGGDTRLFSQAYLSDLAELYSSAFCWVPVGLLVISQALLLFLSVDTAHRRLRPRSSVWTSGVTTAMLLAALTFLGVASMGVGIFGDRLGDHFLEHQALALGFLGLLWIGWGGVFYAYARKATPLMDRAMSWLLRGSILELLIAVPCHVIVRRRDECSAPAATSFGITTGLAIMLLSFGPSVLFLYQKRLHAYGGRRVRKPPLVGAHGS